MKKIKIVNLYYKRKNAIESSKLCNAYIKNYKITEVFVIRNSYNEWEVTLELSETAVILYTKRNKIRTFSKLGTVADYLNLLGVSNFTVIQEMQKPALF